MMGRKRFLGAISVLVSAGIVNLKVFDFFNDDGLYPHQRDMLARWRNGEQLNFSPATPGDFKVRTTNGPIYTFTSDSDTGMYHMRANGLGLLNE